MPAPARTSTRRKSLLFGSAVFLLFFGILEVLLWASGVTPLLSERDPFQGFSERVRVYELDPRRDIYRTPPRAVRHSFNYQEFSARKPANGFRIFTLGGSSAYGFPWGARVAFTRFLGEALKASRPDLEVEAVNAAAMSYGSHRLRILTHEILNYEPDVLVIYEGHNEFVERRFYRDLLERSPKLDILREILYRWRLYSLLARLHDLYLAADRSPSGVHETGEGRPAGELLGLDVVREYSTQVSDAEKEEVRGLFERNLRDILDRAGRAGVRVVLCTVPSNLSGWVPNESFFGPEVGLETRQQVLSFLAGAKTALGKGEAAAAATALERARALAPGYAEVHFRLGQAYEHLGRFEEARRAYLQARDTDGKPSRAIGSINDTIRRLAGFRGAIVVDVERVLEEASPNRLLGFNLIEDYVHPKPEAHRLIALELWKVFQEQGLAGRRGSADPREFWTAVGHAGEEGRSPSEAGGTVEDSAAATPALLFNLGVVLENRGLLDQAMEKYRSCLNIDPAYSAARYNLARLLHRAGRFEEAAAEHRRTLETEPRFVLARVGLGEALRRLGRLDESREAFEEATRVDPGSAHAWDGLGGTLAQGGLYAEAETAFRRAIELDPKNVEFRANLAFALLFHRKLGEAEAVLREALALRPDSAQARDALASVLMERGALDEAERIFRETLRLHPDDALARSAFAEIGRRRSQAQGR